jgi:Protein of unknown function (DUF3014)
MDELSDYELEKTEEESSPAASGTARSRTWWIIAGLIVAAGVPAYFWYPRNAPDAPAATAPTVAYRPLTAPVNAPPTIEVPPLDQSDALVRRLVGTLSSHPLVLAWLATPNLIRTFTVAVENVANGATPARHVRVLRPAAPFRVVDEGEVLRIDPRSYERYNGLADVIASIDTQGATTLYATLKPRIEEAYQELGRTDGFDTALENAIRALVSAPVPGPTVPLVYKGALNAFADPGLEQLTAAQKQLLRMGPRNVRLIQLKLRDVGAALGFGVAGEVR